MHTSPTLALVTFHAGHSHSSLALRSIAAYCRDEPFYPGLRLFEPGVKGGISWLAAELVGLQPAIIGFSTYLWNIEASLRLAAILRKLLPDTMVVFGGPEAGPQGEALLGRGVDFVVDGEGERAFRDLVRWQLYGEGGPRAIAGLVWRDERGAIHRNPPVPLPPEELPSPLGAGLIDTSKPLVYWETSRGCPYRCTFCTSAGDRLRTLPLTRIDEELALLRTLEGKTVKLLDRSFHLGARRTVELLERFIETPESLRFHLELNPDRISAEALALFARAPAGKFQFEIGLQTLDGPVLTLIERHMDVEKGLENIRRLVALKRHPVHLDLIIGLPEETAAQCRQSLDRTFLLFADHLQLGTLKLLPGTPLRAQAVRFGYIWDEEPPYEILGHQRLGFQELVRFKLYAELLERLWNSGLLVNTLMRLVPQHFGGSISACFDRLLAEGAEPLAMERQSPEAAFAQFAALLEPYRDDATLMQLLRWDYCSFTLPGHQTPPLLAERLTWATVGLEGKPKRLPLLILDANAAEVVNRRRLDPLAPGGYALWPQKHRKHRPLEIIPVHD